MLLWLRVIWGVEQVFGFWFFGFGFAWGFVGIRGLVLLSLASAFC